MQALLYFAIWAVVLFLMMRFGCGSHAMGLGHGHQIGRHGDSEHDAAQPHWVPPETDTDPVCGKTVRTETARPSIHEGRVFYFCSRECRERFEAAPDIYIGAKSLDPQKSSEARRVGNESVRTVRYRG